MIPKESRTMYEPFRNIGIIAPAGKLKPDKFDTGVAFLRVRAEREWRPPDESECSSVESERGRGLFLVDAVCESRSYSPEQGFCVTVRVIGK